MSSWRSNTARDVLLTAVDGVAQVAVAAEKGAVRVILGAVHGSGVSRCRPIPPKRGLET